MFNNTKNFKVCEFQCPLCEGIVLFDEQHNEFFCRDCGLIMNIHHFSSYKL